MQHLSAECDMEVVLPYIKSEWLVAVRRFDERGKYDLCKTTFTDKDKFPEWTVDVRLDGAGYAVVKVDNKLKRLNFSETVSWVNDNSMIGAPGYFTVKEALEYCNRDTKYKIMDRVEELDLITSTYRSKQVQDLFGGSICYTYS